MDIKYICCNIMSKKSKTLLLNLNLFWLSELIFSTCIQGNIVDSADNLMIHSNSKRLSFQKKKNLRFSAKRHSHPEPERALFVCPRPNMHCRLCSVVKIGRVRAQQQILLKISIHLLLLFYLSLLYGCVKTSCNMKKVNFSTQKNTNVEQLK